LEVGRRQRVFAVRVEKRLARLIPGMAPDCPPSCDECVTHPLRSPSDVLRVTIIAEASGGYGGVGLSFDSLCGWPTHRRRRRSVASTAYGSRG
jgi:hypothetical protein